MGLRRIVNNEYGLAEMQEQLMVTLDAFDRICRKNNIRYSLHGGTLLGAERDHHLIPWDDDMDVSMLQGEYVKFRDALAKSEEASGFYIDDSTLWVPHFVMKGTDTPVYIDIFLWDSISEKRICQKLKMNLLRGIQGMMKDKNYLDIDRFDAKNKILVVLTYAFGRLFTQKAKQRMYTMAGTKCFCGNRKFIHRYNDSFRGLSYIHDAEYMNSYSEMELEGKNYMVNTRYKEFLISEYGPNYMIPPEESKRRPNHDIMRQRIQKTEKTES